VATTIGGAISNKIQPVAGTILTQQRPVIEDYQLPPRYRRHILDEKEINSINVSMNLCTMSRLFYRCIGTCRA